MSELFERLEVRVAVALIIGLVIGAEREQRLSEKESPSKSAGIRTFTVVALMGATGMLLAQPWLLAVLGLGVISATLMAYALGDRTDPGLTSELALVLTFALGALAIAQPSLALATGIVVAMLLAFRSKIHSLVNDMLTPTELRDVLLVAGAALVMLPMLPDRAIDPFGAINPFVLWRLVVVILAVHLAAHLARRVLGARWGMMIAGLASGFVSSSATIAAMGRAHRDASLAAGALAAGTASNVATFVQLAIIVTTASPTLAQQLAPSLGAGAAVAVGAAAFFGWRASQSGEPSKLPEHAIDLRGALTFAALVAIVSLVSAGAQRLLGDEGVVATAAMAGLADAHASAASVASVQVAGGITAAVAVIGVLACLSTNALTKVFLGFTSGGRSYGLSIGGTTAASVAASWLAWALTR